MYIIRLVVDADELYKSSLLSHLGHQSNSLNLTMVRSLQCDQAGKELLSCFQQAQVSIDVVEQLLWKHVDPNATAANGCTPLCIASHWGHLEVVRVVRFI